MFCFKLIDIRGPSQINDKGPVVTSGDINTKLHKMRLPSFRNGLPYRDFCPQPTLIAGCLNLTYINVIFISMGEISANILICAYNPTSRPLS